MRYVSTRGQAPVLNFKDVVLTGLARDGGLYVPETWPAMAPPEIAALAALDYADAAERILAPFVGDSLAPGDLRQMARDAYGTFSHAAVAPLHQTASNEFLLELFHGPTLAFKDVALQLLGRLFDHFLKEEGRRVTIVGATSGDTGSAAIEACRGRDAVDIFILHPKGRVSDVQRRQMTTVQDANVHNLAIEGDFDDCQALVKAMFNDLDFRDELQLSAINSINWARVMAQVVYYFTAAVSLGAPHRPVSFSVPSGNFGDVYAGYVASRMGLPVEKLIVATNRNDILARFFASGEYRMGDVHPTISPSMDIQVASNFERLLFELKGRDGEAVSALMSDLARDKGFTLPPAERAAADMFEGHRVDEDETLATIATLWRETGIVIDPHTAVGLRAGRQCQDAPEIPVSVLATAHPAKFPEAVERAVGFRPELPARLASIFERDEKFDTLPADFDRICAYIRKRARVESCAG